MNNTHKKLIALLTVSATIMLQMNFALAQDYDAEITNIAINSGGVVNSADITVNNSGDYKVYAAVYDNKILKSTAIANITETGNVEFSDEIKFDEDSQTLKCYVWTNEMTPAALAYEYKSQAYLSRILFTGGTAETDLTEGNKENGYASSRGIVTSILKASVDGSNDRKLEWSKDEYKYTDGKQNGVVPVMTAGTNNPWGEEPSFNVSLSTVGYKDIKFSALLGATKKGPKNFKLQYSTDGENYYDIDNTSYSLTVNKTMEKAFDKTVLPEEANDCENLHIRIAMSDLSTIGGGLLSENPTGGELAINCVKIYAEAIDGSEIIVPTVQPTVEPTIEPTTEPTVEPSNEPTTEPTQPPITGDGVIYLLGDSINSNGVDSVTVSGRTATITAGGEYTISGTLNDGQIVVAASASSDEIIINLDSVSVTSATGDAFKGSVGKVTLVPMENTLSTFTAKSDGDCGIYSKNDITIKGEGILNVVSEAGNGIRSKDDIEIGVCDLTVNAANNGIKGDDSVKITKKNKSVTVVSGGDGIKSDAAPELDTESGLVEGGTVTINGGVINVTAKTTLETDGTVSNGDGIQADTMLTIAGGEINITAAGEAIKANASSVEYLEDSTLTSGTPPEGDGCVLITGGTITASAGEDAIKAVKNVTISGGEVTVTKAEEGIQVNEVIYAADETTVLGSVVGTINIDGGTVNITSAEDGIQCGTGELVITDGDITVNSVMDCLQGETITNISGGTFNLTANGGAPQNISSNNTAANSCKGVKAGNLVYISGGTFNINTYDDAIHSNNTVRILGGEITAATGDDGVHGDSYLYISDDANINVTKSYEGIEAAEIYISGGETRVVSTDDGANAAGDKPTEAAVNLNDITMSSVSLFAGPAGGNKGPDWGSDDTSTYGYIEVSDGFLYIEAEGDGFDSNGSALISGGTVLVNGPTSGGNGVFDIGDNNSTLIITGGTVIGAGTSDMTVTPNSSTDSQYYVVTSKNSGGMGSGSSSGFASQQAGKAFKLADASANEIVTYVPSKTHAWVFVSTPNIESGSYTLNYGGSVSGGSCNGNYSGTYGLMSGATYSGSSSTVLQATK